MKFDVIVDMQFGSTGKGAVAAHLVKERKYDVAVRVQSIQAGHTIYYKGKPYKMRTIPCAWVDPNIKLVLGAGCFIEKELLLREIAMVSEATGEDVRNRLFLDYRATYVLPEDVQQEELRRLEGSMGSTAHGAGASLIRKMWRGEPTRVMDDDWAIINGIKIAETIMLLSQPGLGMVEGCQGTMLSIHTSPYYPFVTAREATASGIIAEAGIPPRDVDRVIGVFRTLPIRVGGNSGPTGGQEISWDEVDRRAGRQIDPERTTVTNRVRRIFEFSHDDFAHAVRVNGPDLLFMTFADYLAPDIYGKTRWDDMPSYSLNVLQRFVEDVEQKHGVKIQWLSTGEFPENVIRI